MGRYRKKDHFHQRAKSEHFAARSVYKLEELDERFGLLRRGAVIVDLGCAPGSWLQYLAKQLGPTGRAVGYDAAPVEVTLPATITAHQADVFDLSPDRIRADLGGAQPIAGLISDMAPKLTGVMDADQTRSVGLAERALWLATELVAPDGFFLAKLFQGRGVDPLLAETRMHFRRVKLLKPKATRDGSREAFVVGLGRRPLGDDSVTEGEDHAGLPGSANPST